MRIYVDTEFMEDGHVIGLLSLGAVREDGRLFYAVNSRADTELANPWVTEHVIPHLHADLPPTTEYRCCPRRDIAPAFHAFCEPSPEFWGYFADYDWVAICQLYGRMIDLPETWPMYCLDVKQEMHRLGVSRDGIGTSLDHLRGALPEHHALADALWTKGVHDFLQQPKGKRPKRGPYARRNSTAVP